MTYLQSNRFDVKVYHHTMKDETVIIDIINNEYLIDSDLNVYVVIEYKKHSVLAMMPYYHFYKSPVLSENTIVQCVDKVLFCRCCDKVIEWKERNT